MNSDYQRLCVRSWRECGLRVVSVNHPEEIPALASSYPEVSFIAAGRNASAISGRRTPYIADLLSALVHASEPVVGIINSDLVFEPSSTWRTWLPRVAASRAVVTGQRHDATSLLGGTFRKYYWGFDFFFFPRQAASELLETAMPFAMGLSWWDYWLPAALALSGRQVLALERPTVAHLIHKEPYLDDSWRLLAMGFASFIVQQAAKSRGPLPESVSAVLPICRELVQMPEFRWRSRGADMQISQIAMQFIPAVTGNVASAPSGEGGANPSPAGELGPAQVFHRFADRLSAGEALERAKRLEREGRAAEARNDFQHALGQTPLDFDVLCAFGEFRLRQGDFPEAVELFRQAIESEPDDASPHCNLALALHASHRRDDAVRCLEAAIRKWPDFVDARGLLAKLRAAPG